MKLSYLIHAVALTAVLLNSASAEAVIWGVEPPDSIQEAINEASDGDTVLVQDGTYTEKIDFLGKAITVRSANGAALTIIDGSQNGSVVTFVSGEGPSSVLDGLTIRNGSGTEEYGDDRSGGGIYCKSPSPFQPASPTITNCIISGSTVENDGGGIFCSVYASPAISNCTITGNSTTGSYSNGGGVYITGYSSPTIIDCTISDNSAESGSGSSGRGGGIYWWNFSEPTLVHCTITGNSATHGGGIYTRDDSSSVISHCIISDNTVSRAGGGIGCRASSVTIADCTINNNTATEIGDYGNGGGMYSYSATPIIKNCTITGNSSHRGGGIYLENDSAPLITDCTITGNLGGWSVGFGGGGGIYGDGSTAKITNCIINTNTCGINGGGIELWSSMAEVTNCTISDNYTQATGSGYFGGGGVYLRDQTFAIITNCTISDNFGGENGAGIRIYWYSGAVLLNSILWSNSPSEHAEDGGDSWIDFLYSDVMDYSGGGEGVIDADPLFVGGGDYHLSSSSPCIDTGTDDTGTYPTLPTDDIDGECRPLGGGYDMGYDEDRADPACADADGDGYYGAGEDCCRAFDCDDGEPAVYYGAPELCDGMDNQCPGETGHCLVDEGCGFDLLGPESGVTATEAPILEWTAGEYDTFAVYLFVSISGYYVTYPVWIECTTLDLSPFWEYVDTGSWAGWGVLGVDTSTWDMEWSGLRWIQKVSP